MAYDESLADAFREALDGEPGVSEKAMFGGLAFLVGGHLAISASSQGGAMVRVDPARSASLVETTSAEVAVMRGRPMSGWLRVPADELRTLQQRATWVAIGLEYARSLPPKE